ncbi:MAG: class III extradiol ring-cleavage dioxygenase [Pseudomonadota bacterium]|nr:class III extradiol ring-cleavage dioxygenase [Pseudomonadota bacterium]
MLATTRMPTLFIPHGGGPCFFMDWQPAQTWDRLAVYLGQISEQLPSRPRAIVVISAHWLTETVTVHIGEKPALLYDYSGFPEHTYALTYPVAGQPALASEIVTLLQDAGIAVQTEASRGLDHGVFIPLKVMFPNADIPVVQISLQQQLDPEYHRQMGAALSSLRDQGVLIVGSGMSFHNLRMFDARATVPSAQFDAWLTAAVEQPDAAVRNQQLQAWQSAPAARLVHPEEEHLIPLMVVAGAAGQDQGQQVFVDQIQSVTISAYQFG